MIEDETVATRASVYEEALNTIVAYFGLNGYYLSAELLSHADDNTVLDSRYIPQLLTRNIM